MGRLLFLAEHFFVPVSYTHLDVYKRQPPNVGRFAEDLCMRAACIEVVEHDVAVGGTSDEHAGVGKREGSIGGQVDKGGCWLGSCLLYTSLRSLRAFLVANGNL